MKKTYLIASGVIDNYYFPEAYLFEIEIIKGVPPLFNYNSNRDSRYNNDQKRFKTDLIETKLIKIKDIIYRASPGIRRKSNAFYDKLAESESKKYNPFEIKSDRKLYFRKKLSKAEYNTFLNKIFVMPDITDGLLFHADTKEKAIKTFKVICDTLYIGILNDNVYISNYVSRNYQTDTSRFLMGKSDFIKKNTYYKGNDDDIWKFKTIGDREETSDLYLEFEQNSYDLEIDIDSTFWKKIKFVMTAIRKEDYKTLNEIYKITKELFPNLKGIYFDTVIFYGLHLNIMPRPIYPFDLCFADVTNKLTNKKLIAPNLKEFLLNRDYFIMTSESDGYLKENAPILKFISDSIIAKRIDGEIKNIKEIITEKEKK